MIPSNDDTQRRERHLAWGICGVLLVAVAAIYGQTLGHALLWYDDYEYVFNNPHVTPGLTADGVHWAFTDGPIGEWYPLAMLSHMLDCQIYGLNAWGHHLTSVLLHAAASVALFLVWRSYTDELWPSAFVAAVFAVHPQHVESVAWVAERRDVLSGLLFVLTLGAWLGYVRHDRSAPRYLLAAALFALGLMAKPMIVTLPAVLLLLDFWPLGRVGAAVKTPDWTKALERPRLGRLLGEKVPLVALALGACLMTLRTHNAGAAAVGWRERIECAVTASTDYLTAFFLPTRLAAYYPAPPGGPPGWQVAASAAVLLALSVVVVAWRQRWPFAAVGWFWYLGMLVPVLGVVQVSTHVLADRYMYLPSIGLSVAVAWIAARCAAGAAIGSRALAVCGTIVLVVLTAAAALQASVWRDDVALWTHAVEVTERNGEAEFGLACALARNRQFDDAIAHFRRAEEYPNDASPFVNLGMLLAQRGQQAEAIDQFRRALALDSTSRVASIAYRNLGQALFAENRLDEAAASFRGALGIDSGSPMLHSDLATVLFKQEKAEAAIAEFEAALAIDARFVPAHINLAAALASRGRGAEAMAHCQQALQIDPQNAAARELLGRLTQATPTKAAE